MSRSSKIRQQVFFFWEDFGKLVHISLREGCAGSHLSANSGTDTSANSGTDTSANSGTDTSASSTTFCERVFSKPVGLQPGGYLLE
jgi:hypothetical protein